MVVLDENERREIARVHRWIDIHPDADRPLARGRKVRELLSQTVYGLTDHAEPASRARIEQALDVLGAIRDQAQVESDPEYWISEGCLPSQAQVLCEARQHAVLDTQAALDVLERVKEVLLEFEGPEP